MAAPHSVTRNWTDAEIGRLRRAGGLISSTVLALEFNCCRSAVLDKERKLGIRRQKREARGRTPVTKSKYYAVPPFPRDEQPLPAGHPETWGLLTRGTVLDGTPWPDQAVSL